MKTAIRIVIAIGVAAAVGWFIARQMRGGVEIVETVEAAPEPDEVETVAEELVEASA